MNHLWKRYSNILSNNFGPRNDVEVLSQIFYVLIRRSVKIIPAKNYETVFKFVKVMHRKLVASFFLDTVYIEQ